MEWIEAKILLKNLLSRIEIKEDGCKQLTGVLTDDELVALQTAVEVLEKTPAGSGSATKTKPHTPQKAILSPPDKISPQIELDMSVQSIPEPPNNVRLCLDFGTAMSKATLIQDNDNARSEEIHVLRLGVPGDQEEVSEVMLISSVYIDDEGRLWFGKQAVDRSMVEGGDGSRQRLDNIKRRLSEEGWDEQVGSSFNPTDVPITQGDMVLAYMMYLTWAVNHCIQDLQFPRNLLRRFAMPCLAGEKGRETVHRLKKLVGEAQILADTFNSRIKNGIPLSEFLAATHELRKEQQAYAYIAEDITEPLGVAGSMISWKTEVYMLFMVVDVGAGTSDFSLYRINIDPVEGKNVAIEVDGSSRGITEAGNHLDRILIELIIKKSGITSDDAMWVNVRSALELQIRDLKETLFNDQFVYVSLINGKDVEIELDEFLQLDAVCDFGENLKATMVDILGSLDPSWVGWVIADPTRRLVVALTGGGSELPMVKGLAEGEIRVNGLSVPVARALPFPSWLLEIDENLEADYPRVAVSLGGARKRLIQRGDAARITAGDVTETAELGGYYTKGR